MPNGESTLVSALNELTALGTERDREQLWALLDRLAAARLRVLVVGEAKRGKSTLINALLGRAVLPSGVTPLTAVTTTVRYGDDERAEVRFLDGHDEKYSLAALPDLVTERGNPGNRRRIAGVTVYVAAPVLEGGVELVDTPGTGSVFEWDTQAALEALRSMDAAVFVLTADPGLMVGQVGRAGGDLQYRLAEATRALARVVGQRYADGTDRIRSALRAAAELREASAAEAGEKKRELAEREAALRHVTALLDQAAAPR